MIARIAALFIVVSISAFCLGLSLGADAPETPSKPPVALRYVAVLKNGEVFTGQISKDGDFFVVVDGGSEIRLHQRDVEMICQSLDDVYKSRLAKIQRGDVDAHLNLADWCLRHELPGYAAHEITAAMQIDPENRKAKMLDSRLQAAMVPKLEPATAAKEAPSARTLPVTTEELDRMVKCLPTGTVENFTGIVQPMLVNSCATAGCHGPNSTSKFTLIRTGFGKTPPVRITQRNLHGTIQWIDNDNPADSRLLLAAREPHGNNAAPAASLDAAKYQELLVWVNQIAQGSKNPIPMDLPTGNTRHVKPLTAQNSNAVPYSPPGSIGSAVQAVAPVNPRAMFSPPARRVAATRASAPAAQNTDLPNSLGVNGPPQQQSQPALPASMLQPNAQPSAQQAPQLAPPQQQANIPAAFNQPTQPQTAPIRKQSGMPNQKRPMADDIPNASEVLSARTQ
jgi:hypothetical protein